MVVLVTIFVIGLCLGSFLNVVIDRWPEEKSVMKGRSHCDYCKKKLAPVDLIPLFSFLFLRGRCRYCQKKLSCQYPLVELMTGLLFVITYFFYSSNYLETVYYLILVCYMIVIFMIDLKLELVLEKVINSAIVLTFLYQLSKLEFLQLGVNLASGIFVALFFLLLIEISKHRGMGEGDVKIGFWMGLILGIKVSLALFIAFVGGALVGLLLIFLGKKKFGQTVPLAPFLMSGMYITLLWGEQIINWYFSVFLTS